MSPPPPHDPPARDPFGLQPLYRLRDSSIVGTSLYDVLPRASGVPDERTLVEYLGFGEVWDPRATFLADIRRVAPGHRVTTGGEERWYDAPDFELLELPADVLVRRFWRTFADAVQRTAAGKPVVVSMSGGLDSAAMAAAAVERLGPDRVRAITIGHETDFDDPEPPLARATARHLGIEWTFVNADATDAVAAWEDEPIWPSEPMSQADLAWDAALDDDEVVLWGLGGDSILRGDRRHYSERFRRGQWAEAVEDVVRTVLLHGQRPAFGLSRWMDRDVPRFPAPSWLRGRAGWADAVERRQTLPSGWRRGFDELFAPVWSFHFESVSPNNIPGGATYVFPFFDLDFATFAASIPTAPWFVDKEILRAALRGRIPEEVRTRPKSPVHGTAKVTMTAAGVEQVRAAMATDVADHLIDRSALLDGLTEGIQPAARVAPLLRAAAVCRWLERLTPSG